MPLHTDERPLEFSQILGNESTVKALETHLEKPSPNRCILFVGQAGCGKTTLAYCVANSLGVYGTTYLKELNSADFRGIDTVREIREETRHQTLGNRIRVYMFEEAHMWTKDAKEGMLKLLENPPKNCWFLVTTSDPQKLYSGLKDPTALKRRFTEFTVTGLKDDQISSMLTKIIRKARKRVTPDVVAQIVKDSLGSPGMALNILDKVIDLPPEDMAKEAKRWAENENKVISLAQFINKSRGKKFKWKEVAVILKDLLQDGDAESLRRQLLGYFNAIALSGDESALSIMYCFSNNLYDSGPAGLTMCVHTALFTE